MQKPMTAKEVVETVEAHGTTHARFCLDQSASQFGRDKLADAYEKLEEIERAEWMSASED